MYPILILYLVITVTCCLPHEEITTKKDELKSFPCRQNAGAMIPSPFDNCNKCFCTKDEKVGGCTRMGCSKNNGSSNNTNNVEDYDIRIRNGQINDELKSFPCRKNAGVMIPSPFDNCNKCFCTKDEKVGGCTRMGCSKNNGSSNNINNVEDYDIRIGNGQINDSSNNNDTGKDLLIGERVIEANDKKICKRKCKRKCRNRNCRPCEKRCIKHIGKEPNNQEYQDEKNDNDDQKKDEQFAGQSPPNHGRDYGLTDDKGDQSGGTNTISEEPKNETCNCGLLNRGPNVNRIVGGMDALPNEFPWQVRLNIKEFKCGGSLISSRTVLTAAHCTNGSTASDISVVAGDHDSSVSDGEINIEVQQIIDHPNSGIVGIVLDNDYSLLILKKPIIWNNKMRPICLPVSSSSSYENKEALVTGWGHTLYYAHDTPEILQKVWVNTMENSKCIKDSIYDPSQGYSITSNMICAAAIGKDACQGDSGGPLITREIGDYYTQIGVVSWGHKCAEADAPGVYARVTSALEWIKTNMQGDICPRKV